MDVESILRTQAPDRLTRKICMPSLLLKPFVVVNDISIQAKVFLCFISALLVTAGLGLFSLDRLSAVNDVAEEIRGDFLPGTETLGDIARHAERYWALGSEHILATTPDLMQGVEDRLKGEIEALKKAQRAYEPTISTPEERTLAQQFSKSWDSFVAEEQTFLQLSRKGDKEAATKLLRKEGSAAF